MDERELAELLRRRGYKLRRVVRYRTRDMVVVEAPRREGVVTITLHLDRKLEDVPHRIFEEMFPSRRLGRPRAIDAETVLKYIRKYPGFDLKAITKLMNLDGIKVSYTTVRRRVRELIEQGLLTREELRGRRHG